MDPDADLDPAIFVIDLQDANKKPNCLFKSFFAYYFLEVHLRGASKIKMKKVNKKRMVTVRGILIFLNISRRPLQICLHYCLHQYKTLKAVATAMVAIVLLTPAKNLKKIFGRF